ncbi:hypothetical protein [Streptomyces sp. NPDC007205]|uniref:hypothetical protein n=1 Tax=Streptomyces sp. NPDC007205 TaxID=3154316 RepID=UPI0033FE69F0
MIVVTSSPAHTPVLPGSVDEVRTWPAEDLPVTLALHLLFGSLRDAFVFDTGTRRMCANC